MNDFVAVALAVVFTGVGGELFVRSGVGIGRWARVPVGIIGVTIAAFATSSPELTVAITAASAGVPQIALGDALGSNVVNISLILAIALLLSGIKTSPDMVRRDFSIALLTPVLIGILAFDGLISRIDGLVLLGSFLAWLTAVVLEAHKQRYIADDVSNEKQKWYVSVLATLIGLAFLVIAGRLIVGGAKGIAATFGIDEFNIGVTLVAVATGMPELATTLIATLRKHEHLGLGNIIGSNIFNGMLIVALAAIIYPITIAWHEIVVTLIFGIVTTFLIFPWRNGHIGRGRGALLLAIYVIFIVMTLQ